MKDTEPMPAVSAAMPDAASAATERVGRVRWRYLAAGAVAIALLGALLACTYLYGEVVALRNELHASRVAARAAQRDADRTESDAESARTALANAQPTDPPDPPEAATDTNGDANR